MRDGYAVLPGWLAGAELPAVRAAADALVAGYLSVKEPRTGALDWHQDWWCWDHPASFEEAAPQIALLPRFDGPRRDLPLNRTPPAWRVAA